MMSQLKCGKLAADFQVWREVLTPCGGLLRPSLMFGYEDKAEFLYLLNVINLLQMDYGERTEAMGKVCPMLATCN